MPWGRGVIAVRSGTLGVVGHRLVFVGGLHRSGTTLLARLLARHPAVSGLAGTGVPADEGQHLQAVYPCGLGIGGPGRFGFDPAGHLTEASPLAGPGAAAALLAAWSPWWDPGAPVWLEKSPPNLVRGRFLQALFPEAAFVMIVRHPIPVSLATRRWSVDPVPALVEHWAHCHALFLDDAARLRRVALVTYESLVARPRAVLAGLHRFLGLDPAPLPARPERGINARYLRAYAAEFGGPGRSARDLAVEPAANAFGYSLLAPRLRVPPDPAVARLLVPAAR
jgi:Sulfotransferase family